LSTAPVLDLDAFTAALVEGSDLDSSFRPSRIRLGPDERSRFDELCRKHGLRVVDEIDRQLLDLAGSRRPPPGFSDADRQREIAEVLTAASGRDAYGNWIHLPWEGKVVHVLAEDDYFEAITSRNRDKITREEQRKLRWKRIGVMGLSVGAEAAVSLAQEHLCGEIVLADFDRLELSNLNRIHAGFDELGLEKAVLAARRIAKIDPYLEVSVVRGGITPKNLESFLDGLDLLVEECDDLVVKREVRFAARRKRVNVVFAADERGFLSVEPYADSPELPPFHGRAGRAQPPRESYDSPLDFLKALSLWLGGWSELSERSRRSLVQVGTELGGYPQLASEARYAAGQIGHVARRLLLGETVRPFLGHLDLEELVPSESSEHRAH
jgi:hypothetical protein